MPDTGQSINIATQSAAVGTMAALGIASAANVAGASALIPVVGPILAGVTLAIGLLFGRSKNGQQKIATTHVVDQIEPYMKQNLAAYQAEAHTPEAQAAALANFDALWAQVVGSSGCGNSQMGDAGKKCISDRSRGGKWDWFAYYRDPIANDTTVSQPTSTTLVQQLFGNSSGSSSGTTQIVTSQSVQSSSDWMIPAAIALGVLAFL